jgi:hypothetical protein
MFQCMFSDEQETGSDTHSPPTRGRRGISPPYQVRVFVVSDTRSRTHGHGLTVSDTRSRTHGLGPTVPDTRSRTHGLGLTVTDILLSTRSDLLSLTCGLGPTVSDSRSRTRGLPWLLLRGGGAMLHSTSTKESSCVLARQRREYPEGRPHRVQGSVGAAETPSTGRVPQSHLAPFTSFHGAATYMQAGMSYMCVACMSYMCACMGT